MAKDGGRGQKLVKLPTEPMPDALNPERFIGTEHYTLDEKGRVTIPKHWRQKGDKDENWRIVPESAGECLRLMEPERFIQFVKKAEELLADDQTGLRVFRNRFVGSAVELEADKQGRIPIPKPICEKFALHKVIVMRGAGDLIEIWNKERFEAREAAEEAKYLEVSRLVGT